jgi:prepilin-type N-terminal cleavage/methylation domain-containing protein
MEITIHKWRDGLRSVRGVEDATEGVPPATAPRAFTLIELLVVIVIIAILMGLAFPAFQAVQNQAKKTQAKNDLVQIVSAVNAFYTEYGKYPVTATSDAQATFGPGANPNDALFSELRGITNAFNTRQIVFLSPPDAKDQTNPRSGVQTSTKQYFDPWGTAYATSIDWDYDNQVTNPYAPDSGAGAATIRTGVISWSLGKDTKLGKNGNNMFTGSDDVISWQ